MKVKQIVNSLLASNTYILYKDEYPFVWIVDIGDADAVKEWLDRNNKILKGVFITHSHSDHIYGLNDLLEYDNDFKVYVSDKGKQGLYSDKLNFSRYHFTPFVYKGDNAVILENRQQIEIFENTPVIALSTPGHDWSCMCYRIKDMLFTGDSYIPGKKVVTTFPKSCKEEADESVEFILGIRDIRVIYPGHGEILKL